MKIPDNETDMTANEHLRSGLCRRKSFTLPVDSMCLRTTKRKTSQNRYMMIWICWFLLIALAGMQRGISGDLPKEFVVAGSEAYQGKDFLARQANIAELQGVWHFGDSESEWSVAIIPHGESFIAQTQSSYFSEEHQTFLSVHATVNKGSVVNGFFKIAQPHQKPGHYNARLIESKVSDPKTGKKNILILLDGNSLDTSKGAFSEAGYFSQTLKDSFDDHYPLSCGLLDEAQLKDRGATELALMRNEIYAYYGMVFARKELRDHFSKKPWYRPWRKNVDDCLTDIEWKNLELIRNLEIRKKSANPNKGSP